MTGHAGPLEGIRVIDVATVIAGPAAAARLGDFGADVIKVEHPHGGDTARSLGWTAPGSDTALWWKQIGRNKRPVTLDLSRGAGQEILLRLVETADVLVESFRPGTLERWNLDPDELLVRNPRLVVLRVSGFGQTGPYRRRPGFGSLAEAMSGYAHMTGFPDGPPVLPPVALADEVAGLLGAFAVMLALYHRDARGGSGQVIDLSLIEALFGITGPVAAAHQTIGVVPGRLGNRIAFAAPRSAYPTKDGRWVALSWTSQSVAGRVFAAIGRPELIGDPRFSTNAARVANVEDLDALIEQWTSERTLEDVLEAFEAGQVAAAAVLDIEGILADPQYQERGTIAYVTDDELGDVAVPQAQPRLSSTPGRVRFAGRPLGAANDEVYGELGVSPEELARLRAEGVM